MEFVQTRIGYHFTDFQLLETALKAAHRDRECGNADDGNRGLARIGILAVEMAETYNAIIVESLTINDANSREHWWKDKKGRAKVCESLGIGSCIKQSARQGDLSPSIAVLDHALSALFGAVWLDCENQGKSASEARSTISKVLYHIRSTLDEPRSVGDDPNAVFVQENILQDPLAGVSTVELMLEDWMNNATQSTGLLMLDSVGEAHVGELEYADNQSLLSNHPMLGEQTLFMDDFQAQEEGLVARVASSATMRPVSYDSRQGVLRMTPAGRAFVDGDGHPQQTLVSSSKRKRARSGKDRATWAYNGILQLERQKLISKPEVERMQLERFLEHPEVDELDNGSVPFRFLYLTIGNLQTLVDFSDQLRVARDTQSRPGEPVCSPSSISETFNTICRLDTAEATCILLKRYYAIKLLEEEEQEEYHGLNSEDILVETPETMSMEGTTQVGNPIVIRDAALIDRQTSKIRPHAQPGSREFIIIRRKVKRIRQLAKRLRGLTSLYGIGILALLPSGSSFSDFSMTDAMLLAMSEQRFSLFIRLLHREQGPLLKGLSEAVAPALTTLATFGLGHQTKFHFENVDLMRLGDVPKAALAALLISP